MTARPGKTAPRLIEDLLNYDPRYEERHGRNILADPPPQFENNGSSHYRAVPLRSCRHALLTKDEQSVLPDIGQPLESKIYKVACFCSECRFHFDVIADFRAAGYYHSPPCPSKEYPLHQFVYIPDKDASDLPELGGPKSREYKFQCSAKDCPTELSIRVRRPQFNAGYIDLLTNRTRLQARLQAAKLADPTRAELTAANPIESLDYLRTYLRDALDRKRTRTKIPMRNKKFMTAFGQDCDDILRELGFSRGESDSDDDAFWYLPEPEPRSDPLESDTLRTKIEDVRAELLALITKRPDVERRTLRNPPEQPFPSLKYIQSVLGCHNYSTTPASRTAVDLTTEEHPHYASLGALGDFSDELVAFSYDRQVECDPENASYYFECLEGIAKGRQSEVLQIKVATLMSSGQTNRRQVEEAYRYLGLDPSSDLTDDYIIGLFKSRLSDVSPAHESDMREMLRIVGQARGSTALIQEASNAVETYAQALGWLGLDEDTADEFVTTMVAVKINENAGSREIARKAVDIIAEARNSDLLRSWLRTGELASSTMDLAEAYRILGIQDRTADIQDGEVLVLQREVAEAEGKEPQEKIQQAFQLIWAEKLAGKTGASNQPEKGSDTWPVGLQNIGNTCYLNSALQFFFTIRPLREWVLNFKESPIDLDSDEELAARIKEKRVGGRFVTVDEVKEGQELVVELKKLFKSMIEAPGTSVRPSSRLPCLAFKKENIEQEAPATNEAGSTAPLGTKNGMPLQGPSLPPSDSADQVMVDAPTGSQDNKSDDTLNDASSTTGAHGSDKANQDEDSGVEMGDAGAATKPEPPTRKPPPPPPRPGEIPAWVKFAATQQDAAEVMDNMTHLLQCAALPEDIRNGDQPGNQVRRFIEGEKTTTLLTERTNGEVSSESRRDPFTSVIVDVLLNEKTIYRALHDELDRTDIIDEQPANGSTSTSIKVRRTWNSIRHLPPILQVHCKRVDFDKKTGKPVRSDRSLRLDDVIYLDRFLEAPQSISAEALLERRQKFWHWQQQLLLLQSRLNELSDSGLDMGSGLKLDLADATEGAAKYLSDLISTDADGDKKMESDDADSATNLPEVLTKQAKFLREEKEAIESKIAELQSEMDAQFEDLKGTPYRLHSIFIHRGGVSGGHYFVYIRDFKDNVWRQYNDEHVTEAEQEQLAKAMGLVQSSDSSTNIVYIRDDQKEALAEAVCRHIVEPETAAEAPANTSGEDVLMIEGVEPQRG